jgi:hypothetical protein
LTRANIQTGAEKRTWSLGSDQTNATDRINKLGMPINGHLHNFGLVMEAASPNLDLSDPPANHDKERLKTRMQGLLAVRPDSWVLNPEGVGDTV